LGVFSGGRMAEWVTRWIDLQEVVGSHPGWRQKKS